MAYVAPVHTVAEIVPGFGSPTNGAFQSLNVAIAAVATTTTNLPAAGVLVFNGANVTLSKGYIRARYSNIAGGTPTIQLTVTATDGTLTTTLYQTAVSAALSGTSVYELVFPFFSELLINKFTFAATTTGAGGTATADYEVAGNP